MGVEEQAQPGTATVAHSATAAAQGQVRQRTGELMEVKVVKGRGRVCRGHGHPGAVERAAAGVEERGAAAGDAGGAAGVAARSRQAKLCRGQHPRQGVAVAGVRGYCGAGVGGRAEGPTEEVPLVEAMGWPRLGERLGSQLAAQAADLEDGDQQRAPLHRAQHPCDHRSQRGASQVAAGDGHHDMICHSGRTVQAAERG